MDKARDLALEVAVVILNWNAAADTLACVRRLCAWQIIQPHIIVVDNASAPADRARLSELSNLIAASGANKATITIFCNPTNQGFSGGTNRGIEIALAEFPGCPILLLNNDADIGESALLTLLEALAAEPKIATIGPLLYATQQPERLISAGSKDPCWHIHTLDSKIGADRLKHVHYLSGSVALFRPEAFQQVGLLDEAFFFNTEIADFCERARSGSYVISVHTQSRAYHDLHRSADLRRALYVYYVIRNRLLYIRKHGGRWRLPLLIGWSAYGFALYARTRLAGQRPPATAIRLGTLDGLRGRFGGQNERVLRAC